MKTSKSLSHKMKATITGLTLITITALFFASCKKDESVTPAALQTATVNAKQTNAQQARLIFASLKFDHYSARTNLPDYVIAIYSNGSGFYEGRANVHVKGNMKFDISRSQLSAINLLCIQFVTSRLSKQTEIDKLFPIPMVTTTYTSANGVVHVFRDFNNDDQSTINLKAFRTKVEQVLDISKYIGSNTDLQQASTEL